MKRMLFAAYLIFGISWGAKAQGTCDTIHLADSIHVCIGSASVISATVTGPDSILSTRWFPATGISDTTILNPTVVTATSGYYYLRILGLIPGNLVVNGDFTAGNTGFTSSYTYSGPPSTILYEGFYSVYTNPNGVHSGFTSFGDHTTGTGNMMIINGGYTATDVWCETISVTPYTDYDFSAWFANCSSSTTGAYAPILQFKINGTLIGLPDTVTASPGTWVNFHTTWNSGASTTANICIYDALTTAGGNDFVIDDITFQKYCKVTDSVYVKIDQPDTVVVRADTSLCSSVGSVTLNATPGYTAYLWNTGATTSSISVTASGVYIAYCNNNGCHIVKDSINVNVTNYVITSIAQDSLHCFPGHMTLSAPSGYNSYIWQDGTTGPAYSVTGGGTYYVDAASYCADFVDTFHVIPTALTIDLGPDVTVCMNYVMTVPVSGTGASYLWQDGNTNSSYSADHTGQYYVTVHQGGCSASDTVNVNFFHYSQNIHDTFICKGSPIDITLECTVPPGGHVLWNDGITSPTREIRDSGTWWVWVSKDECKILDTINVTTGYCTCWHNVPEAFTPNGDGLNDIIRPRIEPGCTISGYKFNIYNRWGERVFTSDFRDKGWDGIFNGVPADLGVYMYSLQFFIGERETPVVKSGTITLIR